MTRRRQERIRQVTFGEHRSMSEIVRFAVGEYLAWRTKGKKGVPK